MEERCWEHFEHDADVGLRADAATREELFEAMGAALTAIITEPSAIQPTESIGIRCEAPEDALLLVDWLNALIFEMATRRMLFGDWQVTLDGQRLEAQVRGETVDRLRHKPVVEVKGATFTELDVHKDRNGRWRGQCIVDV